MTPSSEDLLTGLLDWVRIETHTPDVEGLNRLMDLVAQQAEAFGATTQRFAGREGRGDHLLVALALGRSFEARHPLPLPSRHGASARHHRQGPARARRGRALLRSGHLRHEGRRL